MAMTAMEQHAGAPGAACRSATQCCNGALTMIDGGSWSCVIRPALAPSRSGRGLTARRCSLLHASPPAAAPPAPAHLLLSTLAAALTRLRRPMASYLAAPRLRSRPSHRVRPRATGHAGAITCRPAPPWPRRRRAGARSASPRFGRLRSPRCAPAPANPHRPPGPMTGGPHDQNIRPALAPSRSGRGLTARRCSLLHASPPAAAPPAPAHLLLSTLAAALTRLRRPMASYLAAPRLRSPPPAAEPPRPPARHWSRRRHYLSSRSAMASSAPRRRPLRVPSIRAVTLAQMRPCAR
nr:uncharacterized protein DKFZp434B061-like [Aegilops tauschii subsp. strangulata]